MKRYGILIIGLLAALVAAMSAWAGGTVTVAYSELASPFSATVSWTNIVNNSIAVTGETKRISGKVDHVAFPASTCTGTTYSVTLTDSDGMDVLRGCGTAIGSNATVSACVPAYQAKTTLNSYTNMLYPVGFNSKLTVAVTGLCASNATAGAYSGSVVLYWTP